MARWRRKRSIQDFSGTQLGTVFPAFFLLPTRSYPSQHGSAAFFDDDFFAVAFLGAAFFFDAAFLGAALFLEATFLRAAFLTGVITVFRDETNSR